MSLTAEQLSVGHDSRIVVSAVDLALSSGEAVAILGPNGGGKTTLLKTLLGFLRPRAGRVMVDDVELDRLDDRTRARSIAYVPQHHTGVFAFSVLEVVLMGRSAHAGVFSAPSAADRKIALAMLERLGIATLAERPYTMISGGERQLALVARALAQQPRYIILDEPTASLDFGNQGKVMQQIRALAAEGLGVLFTTHDPNQALRYADRVALIGQGRMLATGAASAVLTERALRDLYQSEVKLVRGAGETVAFLPG